MVILRTPHANCISISSSRQQNWWKRGTSHNTGKPKFRRVGIPVLCVVTNFSSILMVVLSAVGAPKLSAVPENVVRNGLLKFIIGGALWFVAVAVITKQCIAHGVFTRQVAAPQKIR
jgi:hypothetical protein